MSGPWQTGWRASLPALAAREWDVLIIGGGITGAGILLEAARRGLKALLVEQRDFAWGTSSRSSKLVHGGLRYLKEGKFGLTRESVQERDGLLRDARGLVEPQSFAFGDYAGGKPGRKTFLLGLAIYDLLSGRRERHAIGHSEFLMMAPNIARSALQGGMCYTDAKTDDARLVLRVLQQAQAHGGVAVNYMAADSLLRSGSTVIGARLVDGVDGSAHEVRARLVINATGAWADQLRGQTGAPAKIRPLRGSHLIFPAWRLPLAQAVSLMHPHDGRPVFAYPWEGVTLVGTTDVDHGASLKAEAAITRPELDYLMQALQHAFPDLPLAEGDILATYAGVRPVIDSGQLDPSKEGREHAVWIDDGLMTVTGGKLTTFRVIALDALRRAMPLLPGWDDALEPHPIFMPPAPARLRLRGSQRARLEGRYGDAAGALVAAARPGEMELIPGTQTFWAELRWAARAEAVLHLEDLLLRRTRLGLQLRGGGTGHMARIRAICQDELGWDDAHWTASEAAYLALWKSHYSLPT
ncbi:glycerol-3-phosphate dehydrogenase/oxidase [Massilia sp. CF038]|uniref:glycerol-3-phosphate dehydrogenase/oxidase n=1 Tax=Massilia sp. CF038 TaxID=1881045 RepID=UPI0009116B52|nr:glycerol-3-phosphate dehydrogenase/oxidase [Massilia sp. CF038]SHG58334.1 glycerol-3-phosphate dehydrogenase [Massilia sp. CF038]